MALTSPRFADNQRLQQAAKNAPAMGRGESGPAVQIVQQALKDLGYPMPISFAKAGPGGAPPDGIYGDETRAVVRQFQKDQTLPSKDGVVGEQTLGRLDQLLQDSPKAPDKPQPTGKEVTYTHSIATLSWINPTSGLPEVDKGGDPGDTITRKQALTEHICRFSNFLEAFIKVQEGTQNVVGHGFTTDSGLHIRPSFAGIAPEVYPLKQAATVAGGVTFTQAVSCRTESPEKIGENLGEEVGGQVGRAIPVVGPIIGDRLGREVGKRAGRGAARMAMIFPPIWTELELTIRWDGTFEGKLVRHSLFPSNNFYIDDSKGTNLITGYTVVSRYDGNPNLEKWKEKGWGAVSGNSGAVEGNPHGITKP